MNDTPTTPVATEEEGPWLVLLMRGNNTCNILTDAYEADVVTGEDIPVVLAAPDDRIRKPTDVDPKTFVATYAPPDLGETFRPYSAYDIRWEVMRTLDRPLPAFRGVKIVANGGGTETAFVALLKVQALGIPYKVYNVQRDGSTLIASWNGHGDTKPEIH